MVRCSSCTKSMLRAPKMASLEPDFAPFAVMKGAEAALRTPDVRGMRVAVHQMYVDSAGGRFWHLICGDLRLSVVSTNIRSCIAPAKPGIFLGAHWTRNVDSPANSRGWSCAYTWCTLTHGSCTPERQCPRNQAFPTVTRRFAPPRRRCRAYPARVEVAATLA